MDQQAPKTDKIFLIDTPMTKPFGRSASLREGVRGLWRCVEEVFSRKARSILEAAFRHENAARW